VASGETLGVPLSELSSIASVGAVFAAGLLSVFSPCVMPLMPAYLSLISGVSVEEMQEAVEHEPRLRRRVLFACLGFVAGFSTVFVVLGASATAVGRLLLTWHTEVLGVELRVSHLAGLLIIVMGLHLMGILRLHLLYRDRHFQVGSRRKMSPLGTYLVGAAFAFGWSPCVGPILAGVLTIAGSRETVGEGVVLLAIYSAGLGVPFLLAGWSIEYFFRAFQRMKAYFRVVELASGTLLVGVGLLVATDKLSALNSYFTFLNRFIMAAEQALL
jgi:cytochrome c-type biogenesis protein